MSEQYQRSLIIRVAVITTYAFRFLHYNPHKQNKIYPAREIALDFLYGSRMKNIFLFSYCLF